MFPLLYALLRTLQISALYGAGPLLFAVNWKKPISSKWLAVFSIVYTIAACVILIRLQTWMGYTPSDETDAVLWWLVFYGCARRTLQERGLLK